MRRRIDGQAMRAGAAGHRPVCIRLVGCRVDPDDLAFGLAVDVELAVAARDRELQLAASVHSGDGGIGRGVDHRQMARVAIDDEDVPAHRVEHHPVGVILGLGLLDGLQRLQVERHGDAGLPVISVAPPRRCRDGDPVGPARHPLDSPDDRPAAPVHHRHPVAMRDVDPVRRGIERDVIPPVRRPQRHRLGDRIGRSGLRLGDWSQQGCKRAGNGDGQNGSGHDAPPAWMGATAFIRSP